MYTVGIRQGGNIRPVDVICEHDRDGTVTPIRIRLTDEDGVSRAYSVKRCRQMPVNGAYTTRDGVYVTQQDRVAQFASPDTSFDYFSDSHWL